jgi:glutaconate CoA-transferase subunit B
MPGAGPQLVVTDRASFRIDENTGAMFLYSVHSGVTVEVRAEAAWTLKAAPGVRSTEPPTVEELLLIRKKLDPNGTYTRK